MKLTVGTIPEVNYGDYSDLMTMPHLYDSIASDFTSSGIPLPDAIDCQVNGNSNQFWSLTMTYPRSGLHQKEIQPNKWIMEDCDPKHVHQWFKIIHITPELDNVVVEAEHIDALLANSTVADDIQLNGATAQDLGNQILNQMEPQREFNFYSDTNDVRQVNIPGGQQASNLFIDPDQEGDTATQSVLGLFGGEFDFDNWNIRHSKRIGRDSGIKVTYGKNIKTTFSQDKNIQNMYTGAVFVAKYVPGQAIAKNDWQGWATWESTYDSVGITYMAGGNINIYDCPVDGQKIIGTLQNGMKLHLGQIVNDGSFTPDGKYQINTVNSDSWYPIAQTDGGGWIDSKWINFDTSGAYAINNVSGTVTVKSSNPLDSEGVGSRVTVHGSAVVAYGKGKSIRVFYSPEIGPDHHPVKSLGQDWTVKNGTVIDYDMVERNSNGDLWYRIGPHQWLYGPHLSLTEEGSYRQYSNSGYGYVKDGAVKYHFTKDHKMVSSNTTVIKHGSQKEAWKYVGKGKNKHRVANASYRKEKEKKVKVTAKKGMSTIDKTITQGGKTYMHTSHGWVASSSINYTKDGSVKPHSFDDFINNQLKDHSKVEIYATPDSKNALNWSIPNGETFTVVNGHEAKSGDGKTYIEVTYKGKTGWLCEDDIDDKNSKITSADADTDNSADTDTNYNANIDQSNKEVTVKVGPLYAEGFGVNPNIDSVNTVDISGYFKHDDQDLSGQQSDGSFVATQADIDQATEIGKNYLIEHRYGHMQVQTSLDYQDMSDNDQDFTQLSLYDYVDVSFPDYEITEKAEVTATTWDCLAHVFLNVTLGDLPTSYEHLLVQASEDRTNEKITSTRQAIARSNSFIGAVQEAMTLQGTSQTQAWETLMAKLGNAHYKTDKAGKKTLVLDESVKDFANHMQEMVTNIDNFDNFLKSGGGGMLEPISSDGSTSWNNVMAIRAKNNDGSYMEFNGLGFNFHDIYGNPHALFGIDDSSGEVTGNFFVDQAHIPILDASHIKTDTITSLGTINGVLHVENHGISIAVGDATNLLNPSQEIGGLSLDSPNYTLNLGSGSVNIHDKNSGAITHIGPNQAQIGDRNVVVTSSDQPVLGSWIKQYWRGPSKYWDL
ncbi:phage tail spike protein [Lactobacillus crispatus]|uniref:phage tail spike protein n=1 Tax=Lactobacillus crispatus TaxID=47770 RepID=UPI00336A2BA6